MFPANAWYPVFWGSDLAPGQLLSRTVLSQPLVFFRGPDGQAAALEDLCPHRQVPLHLGRFTAEGALQCLYHGLEFNAEGRCVRNPHGPSVPASLRVRTYPVVERHTVLWVWMGDDGPDASRIPDFSLMEDRDDGMSRGRSYLHIEANLQLVADNLLDLSHANYLHEGILGLPEHSTAEVSVTQQGQTITCKRFMPNVPVARLHDLLFKRDGKPIDMWNVVRWDPPGCIVITHGASRPGGAEPYEFSAVHLLTPETDSRTHYSYGIVRVPAPDEESVRESVAGIRKYVFEEQDRLVLEAQQAVISRGAPRPPVMLSVDGASVRSRRVMQQLVDAERQGRQA